MDGVGKSFGKVILLGEHFVVYGLKAIALGMEKGSFAKAEIGKDASILHFANQVILPNADSSELLSRAWHALLAKSGMASPVVVEAHCEMPTSSGLGSSAALGVSIARALLQLNENEEATEEKIFQIALEWEKIFHGNPSGIDIAASMHGGVISFIKGKHEIIECEPFFLAIGMTGKTSSTKSMIDQVFRFKQECGYLFDIRMEDMYVLVEECENALFQGNWSLVGYCMNQGQKILIELGVSNSTIEHLCEIAKKEKALGSKLTGAGGGGCVIALARNELHATRIVQAWKKEKYDGFVTKIQ